MKKNLELALVLAKFLPEKNLYNYLLEQERMIENEQRMGRSPAKFQRYRDGAIMALELQASEQV